MKKALNYSISTIFISIFPIIMTIPLYLLGDMDLKFLVGELAYCLFIIDVILGLRPAILEKMIELKQLYFIHGFMAIFAVIFSVLHDQMSHLDGIAETLGDFAFYAGIGTVLLALVFLSRQFLDNIPYVRQMVCIIREISNKLKLKREVYDLLHVISPLIVVFIFLHVLFIPKFSSNRLFMLFFVGYFVIFSLIYIYYGIYKKLSITRYKVLEVTEENAQVYRLVLQYSKGKKLKIQGGQFVFISTDFAMPNEYHPFSVLEIQDNLLTLGIKKSGDFTEQLAHIQIGAQIKVRGVYGHMTPKHHVSKPIVAIAGGIGVTPCISLLQGLPTNAKGYLIWVLHDESQLAFNSELERLQATHPEIQIIYHYTASKGYLNAKILNDYIPNVSHHLYYLCGPKHMMESTISILEQSGVSKSKIESEGFIF